MSRTALLYTAMIAVLLAVGLLQSWQLALTILNLCLISAVMSLGVNVQWGVAGMFNDVSYTHLDVYKRQPLERSIRHRAHC